MLRHLVQVERADPAPAVGARREEVVAGCCEPSEVERMSARLAMALDLDGQDRDESTFLQEVATGFAHLVEALARMSPVVLVFDDIHEAGPSELDLIERLAARTRRGVGPGLILGAGRAAGAGLP